MILSPPLLLRSAKSRSVSFSADHDRAWFLSIPAELWHDMGRPDELTVEVVA